MVAKLIVWDADREKATRRMARALKEFEIEGVKTLIPFHKAIMASEQWAKGETCRDLIEDKDVAEVAGHGRAGADGRRRGRDRHPRLRRRGLRQALRGHRPRRGVAAAAQRRRPQGGAEEERERKSGGGGGGGDTLASPMQGNIFKVLVEQGAEVEEGALVCIIEAMKMENEITAHKAGKISELKVAEGDAVKSGDTLAVITSG